jgi:phospholipase C
VAPTIPQRIVVGMATLVLLISAFAEVPASLAQAGSLTPGKPRSPIKHVVFILKENRSYDQYFGQFPGADGATTAKCWTSSGGQRTIDPLTSTPDPMNIDLNHSPDTFNVDLHNGAMDGFCHEGGAIDPVTGQDVADSQMSQSQIPNYWAYASHYGLGDRMFAAWRGASFGNNVFALAAQAGRYANSTSHRTIYGLPRSPTQKGLFAWGCSDPADTRVDMLSVGGAISQTYPCFHYPSLPTTLDDFGVGWKYYATEGKPSFAHAAVNAFSYLRCKGATTFPCAESTYWSTHVPPASQLVLDAANGRLPAVSWVVPQQTEHPPLSACQGENSTVAMVNAIMSGPQWASTAVVLSWDEWGGFYDHVVPPVASGVNANVSYGFRVPLVVISPWVKAGSSSDGGSVDSTFYSQPSFARFMEWNWNLPTLGAADDPANYATGDPVPGNMTGFFDFTDPVNPPRPGTLLLHQRSCPKLTAAQHRYVLRHDPD